MPVAAVIPWRGVMSGQVEQTHAVMLAACEAFNVAYRAGADSDTLRGLRDAHTVARSAYIRARAAAGDMQSMLEVVIGAAGR